MTSPSGSSSHRSADEDEEFDEDDFEDEDWEEEGRNRPHPVSVCF